MQEIEIMSIEEKQREIIDEFNVFEDWMEKYEYIIDLGKELPLIDPEKKTQDRIIEGCQSRVWLDVEFKEGKMIFSLLRKLACRNTYPQQEPMAWPVW